MHSRRPTRIFNHAVLVVCIYIRHCNMLQHIATHRNTPQHTATHWGTRGKPQSKPNHTVYLVPRYTGERARERERKRVRADVLLFYSNTIITLLQNMKHTYRILTPCTCRASVYILQHTATHYITLLRSATHCNTLQQHTATTHCNTLQHIATH